jgi:hypothetical protein
LSQSLPQTSYLPFFIVMGTILGLALLWILLIALFAGPQAAVDKIKKFFAHGVFCTVEHLTGGIGPLAIYLWRKRITIGSWALTIWQGAAGVFSPRRRAKGAEAIKAVQSRGELPTP